MPANTPEEWRLSELNQTIERLQGRTAHFEAEGAALAKALSRAARRLYYLRLARAIRSPAATLELWPIGVLIVGSFLLGVLLLVLVSVVTRSNAAALVAFVVGIAASAIALASLLYRPSPEALPAMLAEAEAKHRLADARSKESIEQLARVRNEQAAAIEQRRDLMASGQVQRAALLQREWKTMVGPEWEDFVVEACRTLGASVERTPRTTEKDADLLAQFGNRSVAIVTAGEGHTVNSGAVQHALAGQKRHQCDGCAVIINRRFTGAAQDFARHNGCTLVGLEEFPDFVMGKTQL